jgi:hypothetical protein
MARPKTPEQRTRQIIRERTVAQRRFERELEKRIDAYRAATPHIFAAAVERPRCILAEGDSWFKYVVGKALVHYIDNAKRNEVLNLASPGDEVDDMLSPRQIQRLKRELRRGPGRSRKYDVFLFSGGGNDLLGQGRFRLWLKDYQPGMTAKQVLNEAALKPVLALLEQRYLEIIRIRDDFSPNTLMYLHGYDFAVPNGEPVCNGLSGPWLKPGLVERGVPANLRDAVVAEFLLCFDKMLDKLAKNGNNITVIQSQGTLQKSEWANEIHPTNPGFRKIAKLFNNQLDQDFP